MSFHNRRWAFVDVSQSGSFDFGQVIQQDYVGTRKDNAISGSVATEFMVKWDGVEPAIIGTMRTGGHLALYSVTDGVVTSGSGDDTHHHEETLSILATPRWNPPTEF
jgi:hypothetical protein